MSIFGNIANIATLGGYDSVKDDVRNFFGHDDRWNAKREASKGDAQWANYQQYLADQQRVGEEQRAALSGEIDQADQRWAELYAPMERQLVDDLNRGPDTEGEAALAASRFGTDFDASAEAAERRARAYGIQPGSEQMRRTRDENTYNRARGIAESANTARRAEDDSHFLKQSAFYSQNGSGLKREVMAGLQDMYGADYANYQNLGYGAAQLGNYYQGNADRYAQQSNQGINLLSNIGTQALSAYMGAPAGIGASAGAPTSRSSQPLSSVADNGIARYNAPHTPYQAINLDPATAFGRQGNAFESRGASPGPSYGIYMKDQNPVGNGAAGVTPGTNQAARNWRN